VVVNCGAICYQREVVTPAAIAQVQA
jgi:hypothetical protein